MDTWLHFPLAFVSGFALGGATIFLQFRSRLRFYKHFIETRLTTINVPVNLPRPSAGGGRVHSTV